MQTKLNLKLAAVLLLLSTLAPQLSTAFAQGTAFTYQGRLNDGGAPANGSYDLRFTVYDLAASGSVVAGPLTNSATSVSNGLFTVVLDFGTGVFTGPARWLETAVRPSGNGVFSGLSPRQALTPSPYAIYSETASNVITGSVVKSLNTLKDNVTLAAGSNVTITPSGNTLTIASAGAGGSGIWSVLDNNAYYTAGNVGVGTNSPTPGVRLEVNGTTRVNPGGSGGFVSIGTPSGETGIGIIGTNRADLRFDGSSVKLAAGFGSGAPPSESGIAVNTLGNVGIGTTFPGERLQVGGASLADTKIEINAGGNTYAALRVENTAGSWLWQVTPSNDLPGGRMRLTDGTSGTEPVSITHSGNVGIGTTTPAHRLSLIGGPSWTANLWTGALELGNASAIGWRANAGGQHFGIGQSTGGLYFFRSASDPGTTGSAANFDMEITDKGNVIQGRDKGGLAKAMLFVNQDGTIARCYNGITDSSTGGCGFSVVHSGPGDYYVEFNFKVDDRFISATPRNPLNTHAGVCATFRFEELDPNRVYVHTYVTNIQTDGDDTPFMLIVY
jgi:hypothetical protein